MKLRIARKVLENSAEHGRRYRSTTLERALRRDSKTEYTKRLKTDWRRIMEFLGQPGPVDLQALLS